MTPLRFELNVAVELSDTAMTMIATGEGGVVARVDLPARIGAHPNEIQTQEERDTLAGAFMAALRATAKKALQRQREAERPVHDPDEEAHPLGKKLS